MTNNGTPDTVNEATFPPTDLAAFLRCCAGDWLSLRSRFSLEAAVADSRSSGEAAAPVNGDNPATEVDENSWHASERAELSVTLLGANGDGPEGLALQVKGQAGLQQAYFHADGRFGNQPDAAKGVSGQWTLWPDGSLDLQIQQGERRLRERIWFTKPNLRLRSTVEQLDGASPGRASFSSEIRRVPRPAEPSPVAAAPAPRTPAS